MRSQGSIFVLVALLLAFIVMGIPTTANAIEGTFTACRADGTSCASSDFNDGGTGAVSLSGDLSFCPSADVCVVIKAGSTLSYTGGTGGQALGTLTFSPLIIQNTGTGPVLVTITYGHTNPNVALATSTLCSGMSLSGFFSDATGLVDTNDFTDIQMTVKWLGCNQPNCNIPFQIGSQSLAPCPNTVQAKSSPSLLQASAAISNTYGPANPPQVLNLIPQACNNCTATGRIDKIYQTRLGVGDSSKVIGSDVAFAQLCGTPSAANPKKGIPFCDAIPDTPAYNAVLLPEQIDWVIPGNAISGTKQGFVSSAIFDNLAVKCTDIIYNAPGQTPPPGTVAGEPFLSVFGFDPVTQGAPLASEKSNKRGECDITHDESFLTGLACDTTFLLLSGHLKNSATPGANPIPFGPIAAPVTVVCPH
jgi:hypothetical protein